MQIFKQSTINELIIGVADDATQEGVTGLLFSDVSCKISKEGQVGQTTKTLSSSDWHEIGDGWYRLKMSSSDTDTVGTCHVVMTLGASGSKAGYPFQVVANNAADVMARLGAPAGASVSADVAAVKTDTASAVTKLGNPAGASVSADIAVVAGYIDTEVAAIKAKTDNLPANTASLLDVAISSRLAASSYVAPDNANILNALHAALGLYIVIGNPTYSPSTPDLATVRVRLYDNKAHADGDDGVTGLVVEFTKTVTYSATALSGTAHQIQKVIGS